MNDLILIADADRGLVTTLEYILQREGYQTRVAPSGRQALRDALSEPVPHLVLLDAALPEVSGVEVCRKIRAHESGRTVPVVMLSGRGEESDRVQGFQAGADDVVIKPFSVRELLLRIRAILKRTGARKVVRDETTFGPLRLDIPGHRAWVDGKEVQLTVLEFKLLATLMARRGRVQGRDRLLSDVWGYQPEVTSRTVDTHIKRLREKLGLAGEFIETVRGVGYRFHAQLGQRRASSAPSPSPSSPAETRASADSSVG